MKKLKSTPRCGPKGGVDTPPGLSTAILGDSFEDLSGKRAGVDMWTVFSLLIIKGKGVHISGGGPCEGTGGGYQAQSRIFDCLTPNLGEPFRCPLLCFLYYNNAHPVFSIT